MKPLRTVLASLALVGLLMGGGTVQAQPGKSAAEAVRQVEQQTGGRVLKVVPVGNGYEVKVLLPNGVIRTVRVSGD
ncbi:MAG: hypothetical protein IPM37_05640 [Hahellaceae bacterium]|nr:hypothetical protein [Hahellaceae bacterium]